MIRTSVSRDPTREQVRGELIGHGPGHLGRVEAAREGDGLGRPGPYGNPACAVSFLEDGDMGTAQWVVRPVGPADLDHLRVRPGGLRFSRHGRYLPLVLDA